jgi:ketosteroid isomerase-like protein
MNMFYMGCAWIAGRNGVAVSPRIIDAGVSSTLRRRRLTMRLTRSGLFLLVALVACQPSAPAAPQFTPADEAAVRKNLDDYASLTMAKNWDGIVALYANNAVRFPPNEPVIERAVLKEWLEKYPPISAFEAPIGHVEGAGDLAVATGTYALTANIPGQAAPFNDKGKWFVILKKQADGSWARTTDGWNSDNPPPKP